MTARAFDIVQTDLLNLDVDYRSRILKAGGDRSLRESIRTGSLDEREPLLGEAREAFGRDVLGSLLLGEWQPVGRWCFITNEWPLPTISPPGEPTSPKVAFETSDMVNVFEDGEGHRAAVIERLHLPESNLNNLHRFGAMLDLGASRLFERVAGGPDEDSFSCLLFAPTAQLSPTLARAAPRIRIVRYMPRLPRPLPVAA